MPTPPVDLVSYRAAIDDLLAEVSANASRRDAARRVEQIVTERIETPELDAVLSATGHGASEATQRLIHDIRQYRPNPRTSATNLTALVRIGLLSQIDVVWWSRVDPYRTDADLITSPQLVALDPLRRQRRLGFDYRRQADTFVRRGVRAIERRLLPNRTPWTAGIRFLYARPEAIALLNQFAADFAKNAPSHTPRLWVNSLARSVEHQQHLRDLGYAAVLPSAHCVGYAMDIEMNWFRRFGAAPYLQAMLLERRDAGDVNVIDEGQAWHVCISPTARADLLRDFDEQMDG